MKITQVNLNVGNVYNDGVKASPPERVNGSGEITYQVTSDGSEAEFVFQGLTPAGTEWLIMQVGLIVEEMNDDRTEVAGNDHD
jgi:hypothetical protein